MTKTPVFPDLSGASVFITGGGSGIGAALTEGFVAQGAQVAFVQRSDASAFCDGIEARHGVRPLYLPCDITDTQALKGAIARAGAAHRPVSVLVNNAANDARHLTEEVDEAYWDQTLAVNLKAYFFAAQAVIADMRAAGGGASLILVHLLLMGMRVSGYTRQRGTLDYPIVARIGPPIRLTAGPGGFDANTCRGLRGRPIGGIEWKSGYGPVLSGVDTTRAGDNKH